MPGTQRQKLLVGLGFVPPARPLHAREADDDERARPLALAEFDGRAMDEEATAEGVEGGLDPLHVVEDLVVQVRGGQQVPDGVGGHDVLLVRGLVRMSSILPREREAVDYPRGNGGRVLPVQVTDPVPGAHRLWGAREETTTLSAGFPLSLWLSRRGSP